MRYDFGKIEKKWQKRWAKEKTYHAKDSDTKKKYYALVEFPYPSGEGLHVGHIRPYVGLDIVARKRRMEGYNVLYPFGWDAFGLPTENYAIKTGIHPEIVTKKNTDNYRKQVQSLGISFDWGREVNTTDPSYYKWTQWLFLQFFKHGLAYKAKMPINWCPKDKIGLANEEVLPAGRQGKMGICERCGTEVEQREKEQWMLKITAYADKLLKGLDEVDFLPVIKTQQRNWIGKSEGAEIDFEISAKEKPNFVLLHGFTGSPEKNFFPWLKKELEKRGYKVQVPLLPHKDRAHANEKEDTEALWKQVTFDKDTILLGHSLGTVVAMRALEKLNHAIAGLVLVGGFLEPKFRDHPRPFETTFGWDFDFEKIRANAGTITILHDRNDDCIPEGQGAKLQKALQGILLEPIPQRSHFCGAEELSVLRAALQIITVFTTRPDTIYGATFIVKAGKKDRFTGEYVTNPATKEKIPVWEAEYVMGDYGTGAIMAVPAHDERDFEFAKKYKLPIKQVIEPVYEQLTEPGIVKPELAFEHRDAIMAIVKHWSEEKYIGLKWKKVAWGTLITGGIEKGQTAEEAAKTEIREETGYLHSKFINDFGIVHGRFYHVPKKVNRFAHAHMLYFELQDNIQEEVIDDEKEKHEVLWLTKDELMNFLTADSQKHALRMLLGTQGAYEGEGMLVNSGKFSGMDSEEAKWKITEAVGGTKTVRYKLRDWVFSRQRYWGEPIPLIYCEKDGWVAVPEEDLPVELPKVKEFKPRDDGESPLASVEKWVSVKCPNCGGKARRETDVMPNWAGSSWYYLAYALGGKSSKVKGKSWWNQDLLRYWLPVDWYNGGMEHVTLHLLYSRFWNLFLHDQGLVPVAEPYKKRTAHGLILAKGGVKMSKSRGNVINPDTLVKEFGADALRLYEMFIGPFDQATSWDERGILGTSRFLERVWTLSRKVESEKVKGKSNGEEIERLIQQTIRKVSQDIETMSFNTAVSALMIFMNEAGTREEVSRSVWERFIKLLAPFVPHIASELWKKLGNTTALDFEPWPTWNEAALKTETVRIIVQVNGRVRGTIEVSRDSTESEVKREALANEVVEKWIREGDVARVVFVPNRLINLCTAEKEN